MNRSETELGKLAARLVSAVPRIDLCTEDRDLIAEAARALRSAEGVLTEAALFAQSAVSPHTLRFGWASGTEPFDPATALKILCHQAAWLEASIAEGLFGTDPTDSDLPCPADRLGRAPTIVYVVSTGGSRVAVESRRSLSTDEVCGIALRRLSRSAVSLGDIMSITKCDGSGAEENPTHVLTMDQLEKGGWRVATEKGGDV